MDRVFSRSWYKSIKARSSNLQALTPLHNDVIELVMQMASTDRLKVFTSEEPMRKLLWRQAVFDVLGGLLELRDSEDVTVGDSGGDENGDTIGDATNVDVNAKCSDTNGETNGDSANDALATASDASTSASSSVAGSPDRSATVQDRLVPSGFLNKKIQKEEVQKEGAKSSGQNAEKKMEKKVDVESALAKMLEASSVNEMMGADNGNTACPSSENSSTQKLSTTVVTQSGEELMDANVEDLLKQHPTGQMFGGNSAPHNVDEKTSATKSSGNRPATTSPSLPSSAPLGINPSLLDEIKASVGQAKSQLAVDAKLHGGESQNESQNGSQKEKPNPSPFHSMENPFEGNSDKENSAGQFDPSRPFMTNSEAKDTLKSLVKKKEKPNYIKFLNYAKSINVSLMLRLAGMLVFQDPDRNKVEDLTHEELRIILNFCYGEEDLPLMQESAIFAVRNCSLSEGNGRKVKEILEGKGEGAGKGVASANYSSVISGVM
jgi:hypothetical protein